MNRRLSLHHLSMLSASPAKLAAAAAHGGFEYCGVRIVSPDSGEALHGLVGDRSEQRRFLDHCARLGIELLDTEAVWLREATDLKALVPLLETTAALGARYVLTVGADGNRARLVDRLGEFADLAAPHGLSVPLEFITYTAVTSLADAWAIVQAIGRSNVGILIDALQFFRAGAEFELLSSIPTEYLPYAQIADGPLAAPVGVAALRHEARTARMIPGEGQLDLARLVDALPAGVPLSVEAPTTKLAMEPFDTAAQILHHSMVQLLDNRDSNGGTQTHVR